MAADISANGLMANINIFTSHLLTTPDTAKGTHWWTHAAKINRTPHGEVHRRRPAAIDKKNLWRHNLN